jgi:hypothetical protein
MEPLYEQGLGFTCILLLAVVLIATQIWKLVRIRFEKQRQDHQKDIQYDPGINFSRTSK